MGSGLRLAGDAHAASKRLGDCDKYHWGEMEHRFHHISSKLFFAQFRSSYEQIQALVQALAEWLI